MKVLFLNNFYYLRGGSERVLFEEMKLLEKEGHEVAIFSRANASNESAVFEEHFPDEIRFERLQFNPSALLTVKEVIYSHASRDGLRKVIDSFKPDIAHAHNIYGRLSTSVLDLLKERRIPTVLTLHDLKLLCPSYLMLNRAKVCERCKGNKFYYAIITKCHKDSYLASSIYALETWYNLKFQKYDSVRYFITPSRFLRDKVIEYGWNAEKIVHIPNLIDKRGPAPVETGDYSLFLGRLSREKGVVTLLGALKGLQERTHLVIAGNGPARDSLQEIVTENDLPVTFRGYLSGKELEETIIGAKVIIVPSEWYENAPLSVLEAFAYGKPVIGARIGGIPEMVEEGVNGYLFESGNAADMREKWSAFLNLSDEQVLSMGRNAREAVANKYNSASHYRQLMDVYRRALEDNG